jgi:hypothetical protein
MIYSVTAQCRLVGGYTGIRSIIFLRNVGSFHIYRIIHGVITQKTVICNFISVHPVSSHSGCLRLWRVIIFNGTSWTLPLGISLSRSQHFACPFWKQYFIRNVCDRGRLVFNQPTWAFTLNYSFLERIGSLFHLLSVSSLLLLLYKEMSREKAFIWSLYCNTEFSHLIFHRNTYKNSYYNLV